MRKKHNYLLDGEESKRLLYRKLKESDFKSWMTFCENKGSLDYIWPDIPGTATEICEKWFKRVFLRYENSLGGMNALIDKQSKKLVGQCGLLIQTVENKEEMEIGYSILPEFRNLGYAAEAASKCRDFAFNNNFKKSLISIVHVDNVFSQKVALKNGMSFHKKITYNTMPVNIYRIGEKKWLNF